jgi:uncharacterized protein (TIGR02996 family)
MSVYFVYRTHYDTPTLNHVKKFEDGTVLDWFRRHWNWMEGHEADADREIPLFGCPVYGFYSLFSAILEHSLPQPATPDQLQGYLEKHLYVEGELLFQPHVIQVLTDDDELEMAYYFFDDEYLARHRDKAALLLQNDWQLPEDIGENRPDYVPAPEWADNGAGSLYYEMQCYYDSCNLSDIGGCEPGKIAGIRLPQLAQHLAGIPEQLENFHLLVLRSQLFIVSPDVPESEKPFVRALRENPTDGVLWNAYSDWMTERGQPALGLVALRRALQQVCRYPMRQIEQTDDLFGSLESARQQVENCLRGLQADQLSDPSKSLIQVSDHVAQLCLHTERWGNTDLYHRWIFFDDLWAAAHPDLARAIQTYSSRWDVLS